MSDVVLDLLTALNKQAISKIKLVTLKNRRGDAEGEPVTHSEIFDAKFKNYMGRHDQQMHTTLFNLANPSQGRGGGQKNGNERAKDVGGSAGSGELRVIVGDDPKLYGDKYSMLTQPSGASVRGTPISPNDEIIPDTLFHVTTNLSAILDSGKILAGGVGGLGGDDRDKVVSMTISKPIAEQLLSDLKFVSYLTKLYYRDSGKIERGNPEHVAVARKVLGAILNQIRTDGWPKENRDAFLKNYSTQHILETYSAKSFLNTYFWARQSALGIRNPIIMTEEDALSKINPKNMGIIQIPKTSLRTGALVTNFDVGKQSLEEIRIYGDVPIGKQALKTKERVLATISEATLKNYMGRHDQQMHTTLFNLANPSQGRRDVARGGEVRELAASTAPTRTLTAMSAAESGMSVAESNFNFLLNTEAKIERNIKLNQFIIGYEREIREELSRTKENIGEHAKGILERTGYEPNPDLSDIKQLWSQRISEYKQRAEVALANAKANPNNEGLQRLAEGYRKIHAANHAIRTLLYRDDKIMLPEKQALPRDDWRGGRRSPNPLNKLNWDGNTTSYEIPQYGKSGGLADKSVLGGERTERFIRTVAKELGIPPASLKFARDQPIGRPDTLADYKPYTSITTPIANTVTVYPLLIGTNATTNSKQTIRGVLGHEAAHMRYETVSLAVRTATTPASSRDLWWREQAAEMAFGDKTAGSLRQAGFLGSKYEVKMLKAITDPTSVFKVGKDGSPKAKQGYGEYLALFKTDGLTDYSASFWKDFSMFPSARALKVAINETLAEVTRLTELGHGGKISRLWRDASELLNSTYGKLGSPWKDMALDMDIPVKIKEKSEYDNVKFPKQSIIDALRGLVDKYQADKSAKIAAANPPPEKYTSKSLKNLTKQHGLLSTKLLRVALKNTEGKKMKMIILGQTGDSLLVAEKGQDFNSGNAKGFYLDLSAEIAYDVGVAQSYKFVPWQDADGTLKIPKWFNGKATPKPELSAQEMGLIRSYLEDGYIDLNELLRNNSKIKQEHIDIIDALDKALMIYGTRDYGDLYGAIPNLNADALGLLDGVIFRDTGMQSAYDNPESALALLKTSDGSSHGTLIKYMTKEINLRNAIDMRFIGESNEFLFPRNTIFTVVDVERSAKGNYDTVTMDCSY